MDINDCLEFYQNMLSWQDIEDQLIDESWEFYLNIYPWWDGK